MTTSTRILLASLALVGLCLVSCGGKGVDGSASRPEGATGSLRPGIQGELMLGLMLPFTGPVSANYEYRERYVRLAIHEINASGGVNGKSLGYVIRDTKAATPLGVASHVNEYLDLVQAGCFGIIGPLTSAETLLIAPTVLKTGVPIIGTGPSSTVLSTIDRGTPTLVYRLTVSDSFAGKVAAQVARREGRQTVAIIHSDDAFGVSISETFRASFTERGGQVLALSPYKAGQTSDFVMVLAKAMAKGRPDAIYFAGQSAEVVGLTKDMVQAIPAPRPALYAASSISTSQFVSTAEPTVVEGMTIMGASSDPTRLAWMAVMDLYAKTYGEAPPVGIGPSGYDATYLFALAAQAGGSTAPASIAKWLRPVSRAEGPGALRIIPGQFDLARRHPGVDWDYDGAESGVEWDAIGDVTTGSFIVYRVTRGTGGQMVLVQVDQVIPD